MRLGLGGWLSGWLSGWLLLLLCSPAGADTADAAARLNSTSNAACRNQIRQAVQSLASTSSGYTPDFARLEQQGELLLEKRARHDDEGRSRDGRTRELPISLRLQLDAAGACWLVKQVGRKVLLDQCGCEVWQR